MCHGENARALQWSCHGTKAGVATEQRQESPRNKRQEVATEQRQELPRNKDRKLPRSKDRKLPRSKDRKLPRSKDRKLPRNKGRSRQGTKDTKSGHPPYLKGPRSALVVCLELLEDVAKRRRNANPGRNRKAETHRLAYQWKWQTTELEKVQTSEQIRGCGQRLPPIFAAMHPHSGQHQRTGSVIGVLADDHHLDLVDRAEAEGRKDVHDGRIDSVEVFPLQLLLQLVPVRLLPPKPRKQEHTLGKKRFVCRYTHPSAVASGTNELPPPRFSFRSSPLVCPPHQLAVAYLELLLQLGVPSRRHQVLQVLDRVLLDRLPCGRDWVKNQRKGSGDQSVVPTSRPPTRNKRKGGGETHLFLLTQRHRAGLVCLSGWSRDDRGGRGTDRSTGCAIARPTLG